MSIVTATILSDGKSMDPKYELLSIDISKEVNRIPDAQLLLLDGDAAQGKFEISDTAFFEPGKAMGFFYRLLSPAYISKASEGTIDKEINRMKIDIRMPTRKQKGLNKLRKGLEKLGIKGLTKDMNDHELDAVTCALVGKMFLERKTETLGDPENGIVMPKG